MSSQIALQLATYWRLPELFPRSSAAFSLSWAFTLSGAFTPIIWYVELFWLVMS